MASALVMAWNVRKIKPTHMNTMKPKRRENTIAVNPNAARRKELAAEHFTLSSRYDKDYARAAQFGDASIADYERSAEAKRIMSRIVEIDAEYASLR
jgi:hypothetical protein